MTQANIMGAGNFQNPHIRSAKMLEGIGTVQCLTGLWGYYLNVVLEISLDIGLLTFGH